MPDLDGFATELDQRASNVELIGDQLMHAAAVAIWSSVAADAFRMQVSRRRRDCGDVASMLRSASAAVRHYARDVEVEKERLRRLEELALHGVEQGVARMVSLAVHL